MMRVDGVGVIDIGGGRFVPFEETIVLNGVDWSGDTFKAEVRLKPNAAGSPLATMTIGPRSYSGGATRFTIGLAQAAMEAMPAGALPDADAEFHWDLVRITGGVRKLILSGNFIVYAGVTK